MNEEARLVTSGHAVLLVHPAHAATALSRALRIEAQGPEAFDRMRGERAEDGPWNGYRIDNGMALIPVMGVLVPHGTFFGYSFATSYEALRSEFARSAQDPAVGDTVGLMIDSPGGYVSGIDATAAALRDLRKTKRVVAYVQGMCCSAAYWLASQCDEIVTSELAEVGSIGVVQAHFDVSKMMDDVGIKVTLLHAGAKKVDGNSYAPLSKKVADEMQQRLDDMRTSFATAVADGRGMTVAAVLATEADTYLGPEAVTRGLADKVGLLAEGITPLTPPNAGLNDPENDMDTNKPGAKTFTQAQFDAALATALAPSRAEGVVEGHAAGKTEGKTEGFAAGATAERTRIETILGDKEAAGRESQASFFAFKTDFAADVAIGALANGAKVEPPQAATLETEMTGEVVPAITGGPTVAPTLSGDAKAFAEGAATAKSLLGKK